ncbi:MAG: ABC transporter ATP-binding protein [Bacteroidetes bacterium]|nr:ABC transporter ATP-binding protein [Bacteroidota bacterium]
MIQVKDLTKKFGSVEALRGISFSIEKGEIFGLLGPNGAGKTTTISILSTLSRQDAGEVSLNGFDLNKDAEKVKRIIGVVPQEIALYQELSAYDNLIFWGSLYTLPSEKLKAKANEILKLVGLYERKEDKIKTYSGGMKRRINIASALLHSPEIIFMDEPTVGIDPQSRNLIYEVIEKLNKEGITLIYTTHYMEEAERLCKRIGIIDNGKIIAQGTLDELRSATDTKQCIVIKIANIKDERVENENLISKFMEEENREAPGRNYIFRNSALLYFSNDIKNDLLRLINRLSKFGLEITHVDIQRPTLESIFLSLTGKELRD